MVCYHVVTSMGPRYAYKDMLDIVVSPIACVSMNHQNQLEQMENGAMFATNSPNLLGLSVHPSSSSKCHLHSIHQMSIIHHTKN
jgi:hypothetical protein